MRKDTGAQPATLADETARYLAWKEATLDRSRPAAVAAQGNRGALTARERIARFLDPGSFVELGQLGRPDTEDPFGDVSGAADGIVTGTGRVEGRPVAVVSYDFTVSGGSMGRTNDEKFARARQISLRSGVPLVMFVEGGGARITERMGSTTIRGHERFSDLGLMSGWAPILCGVVGHTYAGHANLVALSDYVGMVKGASLGLAGPRLVKAATGEDVTTADFGSELHAKVIGSVDHEVATEGDLIQHLRRYLSFMPSNCTQPPPRQPYEPTDERLDDGVLALVSASQRAYDMRKLVRMVLDKGSAFELKPTFAPNLITAFGRMGGHTVGLIANNPMFLAGVLDGNASDKMSRFVNICDAFNIPLVWLVDVPGYIVGTAAERTNLFRRSMRPLWELSQSTVPICTVVVRKAFGLAYHTMGGAEFHPALMVCWPSARVSPMGAEGAVNILYGKVDSTVSPEQRAQLVDHYKRLEEPAVAGAKFKIDDVIDPRDTRLVIIQTLDFIADSRHESGHWRPPKKRGIAPA